MKKVALSVILCVSLVSAKASDTLVIKIDTTTFKNIVYIIQTQIDSKTSTKYIMDALGKAQFVADKPKKIIKP